MKNTLKLLGILFVIAAAIFVAACGPIEEPEEETGPFTVTFNANGGTLAGSATQTVEKDATANKPDDPTPPTSLGSGPEPTEAGLYEITASAGSEPIRFVEWRLGSASGPEYKFTEPVTKNITLFAFYTGGSASTYNKVAESMLGDQGNTFATAVSYINSMAGNPATRKQYLLVINENITFNNAVSLNYGDLKVTRPPTGPDRNIKSGVTLGTSAALTIGQSNPTAAYNDIAPILTLVNVGLRGSATIEEKPDGTAELSGAKVANSLVRIQSGGTLNLGDGSSIKGHNNSAAGSNGATGNGSAVCIINGGTLNMEQGSVIEHNMSSAAIQTNKNLVGGVYTIITTGTAAPYNTVTLNITGGSIVNNIAGEGQTADVYATEGGVFNLGGNVKINEITLNADKANANSTVPTDTGIVYTSIITINSLGTAANVNLSLRSTTSSANNVRDIWLKNENPVIQGPNKTAPSASDVAAFHLKEYKWNGGNANITGHKLGNDGKFVAE